MKYVTFQTEAKNHYLYSPSREVIIPIAKKLFRELQDDYVGDYSKEFSFLYKEGYLDQVENDFSERIKEIDIEESIRNTSQIVFEMTTNCNLRCEYCCYSDGYTTFKERKSGNLKFETAKTILDYFVKNLSDRGTRVNCAEPFAISFYGGEPLLNFSILKKIVEYAETLNFKGKDIVFTMTTNALLLRDYADFFELHNFRILVSLDGDRKHDFYRKTAKGKESFDIVKNNILYIKEHHPKLYSYIRFNAVYTNIGDITEIIRFFDNEFGKTPKFSTLHTPQIGAKDFKKISQMQKALVIPKELAMRDDLLTENPIHKRVIDICTKLSKYSFRDESQLIHSKKKSFYPSATCLPFSKRVFVSFDGKLHPCEKISRSIPWGEVTLDGNLKIDISSITERFNTILHEQQCHCSKCYLQKCCNQCVLQLPCSKCNSIMSRSEFSNVLSQSYTYIENYPNIVNILNKNIVIK